MSNEIDWKKARALADVLRDPVIDTDDFTYRNLARAFLAQQELLKGALGKCERYDEDNEVGESDLTARIRAAIQ